MIQLTKCIHNVLFAAGCVCLNAFCQEAIHVDPNTGNVGIGTQTPEAKLHVKKSDGRGTTEVLIENDLGYLSGLLPPVPPNSLNAATKASTVLQLKAHSEEERLRRIGEPSSPADVTEGTANIRVEADHAVGQCKLAVTTNEAGMPVTFETHGGERLRIDDAGRVGIGTAEPQASLDVGGNFAIRGRPVINDAGQWIGDPSNLVGRQGPAGPAGPAGANSIALCGVAAGCTFRSLGSTSTDASHGCSAVAQFGSCSLPPSTNGLRGICNVCRTN